MAHNKSIYFLVITFTFLILIAVKLFSLKEISRTINLKTALYLAKIEDNELNQLQFDHKLYETEQTDALLDFFPKIESEIKKSNSASIIENPRGTTIITYYNSMTLPVYDRAVIYNHKKLIPKLF